MAPSYNLKNPAVKRILQEIKEVQADTSGDLMAEALETDIFEWHFAIRGPSGTDFEGGIYHGRILLPAEYPFKPPAFMMLTPSGRFETGMKICLSISTHHPEHWQPSWSVRTALTALIAFMPSPAGGALGALEYTPEERRKLAAKSRLEPPKWGSPERQQIISDMHERMLAVPPAQDPSMPTAAGSTEAAAGSTEAGAVGSSEVSEGPGSPTAGAVAAVVSPATSAPAIAAVEIAPVGSPEQALDKPQVDRTATQLQASVSPIMPSAAMLRAADKQIDITTASLAREAQVVISCDPPAVSSPGAASVKHAGSSSASAASTARPIQQPQQQVRPQRTAVPPQQAAAPDTWALTVLAVILGVLIAAIVLRKALVAVGYQPPSLLSASFDHEL